MAASAAGDAKGANKLESLLEGILKSGNYQQLVSFTTAKEIEDGGSSKAADFEIWHALQLVGHLLNSDLPSARFLWKRLSKDARKSKELTALWAIGKTLWRKDSTGFYTACDSFAWSKVIRPFVLALKDNTRAKTLQSIAQAYASIALVQVAEQLGLPKQQAAEACVARGWVLAGDFLTPKAAAVAKNQDTSVQQLSQLTSYLVHLEAK